eukprot:c8729_g2_i2.p1 GENE.c8729_g2_i2~~c8729_g2_i2.p1  ORF type:complete len:372 (-),score=73.59 c8729_g2_i2:58-1173(-)
MRVVSLTFHYYFRIISSTLLEIEAATANRICHKISACQNTLIAPKICNKCTLRGDWKSASKSISRVRLQSKLSQSISAASTSQSISESSSLSTSESVSKLIQSISHSASRSTSESVSLLIQSISESASRSTSESVRTSISAASVAQPTLLNPHVVRTFVFGGIGILIFCICIWANTRLKWNRNQRQSDAGQQLQRASEQLNSTQSLHGRQTTQQVNQTFRFDVFISHDWGNDASQRDNHARAVLINKALQVAGLVTWFDDAQLSGNMMQKIAEGMDASRLVVILITRRYMERASGVNPGDYCYMEFNYAATQKTAQRMIPIVMEEEMIDRQWMGMLGFVLSNQMHYRFTDDSEMNQLVRKVVARVREFENM